MQAETVFYDSIYDVNSAHWDSIVAGRNIYLSVAYLQAVEDSLPAYDFRYFIFHSSKNERIGIGYCQIIKIGATEINVDALSKRMGGMLPKTLVKSLDMRILICGNAFASGENGFLFDDDLHDHKKFSLLNTAIDEVQAREKKKNKSIAITIIKEFWPASFGKITILKEKGYSEIDIDVNMVLPISDAWKTFEDYLSCMNSKFRTKAKQVLKKSSQVSILDFTHSVAIERESEINELYNFIVDRANFSFGRLNALTLINIKKALGEDFFFRGYYIDNKLIGFSTATYFNQTLDGNFIGLDYDYNQEYCIYQRMLYDFTKHAIDRGATNLKIGRTAEEIKSGIGAVPIEMKFYAKHRNKVTNAILRPFIQNLKPSEFNLRKPFKAEYYQNN